MPYSEFQIHSVGIKLKVRMMITRTVHTVCGSDPYLARCKLRLHALCAHFRKITSEVQANFL